MLKKKKSLAIFFLLTLVGCEAKLQETTIQAHKVSVDTRKSVIRDMQDIAVRGQLGLTKKRLDEIASQMKSGSLNDIDGKRERDVIVNQFAQTILDISFLMEQHNRAYATDMLVGVYLESRKSWLELVTADLKTAWNNYKINKAVVTTQPAGNN